MRGRRVWYFNILENEAVHVRRRGPVAKGFPSRDRKPMGRTLSNRNVTF